MTAVCTVQYVTVHIKSYVQCAFNPSLLFYYPVDPRLSHWAAIQYNTSHSLHATLSWNHTVNYNPDPVYLSILLITVHNSNYQIPFLHFDALPLIAFDLTVQTTCPTTTHVYCWVITKSAHTHFIVRRHAFSTSAHTHIYKRICIYVHICIHIQSYTATSVSITCTLM